MAIGVYTFKVTGLKPILMNNPNSMNDDAGKKTRTKKVDPEEEARVRAYVNDEGSLYIPSIAFLNSLWEGASYEKIGKDSARARIASSIFVIDQETILYDQNTNKPIDEYVIDSRYVVIKSTQGRIMRHRPKVDNWYCLLSLEVDTDYISVEDNIIPLFNKAGRVIGVLDYRPAKRGGFGRYEVELYKGNGNSSKSKITKRNKK